MYKTVENASKIVDNVIQCAGCHFRQYGFRGATVDGITRELRISKRTLYVLFASKEEILREVAWRDTLDAVRVFAATISPGTPSERMLLSLCRHVFIDRIRQGKTGRFSGLHHEDQDLRTAYREAFRRVLADLYGDGRQHGRLKPVDPQFAGAAILALVTTATERFHLTQQPMVMFNDTLTMIADAIAYHDRVPFDLLA